MQNPSPASFDLFALESERSDDNRFIFVDLPPRRKVVNNDGAEGVVFLRLKLKRVASAAPLLAGVPALLDALPSTSDEDGEEQRPISESELQRLLDRFEQTALGAACSSVVAMWDGSHERGAEDPVIDHPAWRPLRLTMRERERDPAAGVLHIDDLTLAERMALGRAVVEHSTGKEVGSLRALLFRVASAVLEDLVGLKALLLHALRRAMHDARGEDHQRGGDHVRDDGGESLHAEGEGHEADPDGVDDGRD